MAAASGSSVDASGGLLDTLSLKSPPNDDTGVQAEPEAPKAATRHVTLTSVAGEPIGGEVDALCSQSLSELKVEFGLELYKRLILGGKILQDETLIGELDSQGELPETVCLQVVVPAPCLAAHDKLGCTILEDRLGASCTSLSPHLLYMDRTFSSGSHVISFRLTEPGNPGFTFGVLHTNAKPQLGGNGQPGSAWFTWGWTACDGVKSVIEEPGGWHAFTEKWDSPGTEVKVLLNCDVGSLSVAVGSSPMQEAWVHPRWAAAPLEICWYLKKGSKVDSIAVLAA